MIPFYYGILVIGPSGAGKTTLCAGLKQMMTSIGRKCCAINLDPANENDPPGLFDVNIMRLITVEDVMKEFRLGPNGALLYCFQFLQENLQWLFNSILQFQDFYLIFDFPGQIELYINNDAVKNLVHSLTSKNNPVLQLSLAAVELFDCLNCYQDNNFVSQCITSLCTQMNLEIPYFAALNKLDLLRHHGPLPMSLEYYLEASDLTYLLGVGQKKDFFKQKYAKLLKHIAQILDDQRKVSFEPLFVENKKLVMRLIIKADKANGYFMLEAHEKDELYSQLQDELGEEVDYMPTELIMELESELFPEETL